MIHGVNSSPNLRFIPHTRQCTLLHDPRDSHGGTRYDQVGKNSLPLSEWDSIAELSNSDRAFKIIIPPVRRINRRDSIMHQRRKLLSLLLSAPILCVAFL